MKGATKALRRWLDGGMQFSNRALARLATVGMLVALVAFHAINNWRWLTANVTVLGWDVPSHLGTSFVYDGLLRPLTLKTLFASIVWHPNRPPLFFLSAIPLYRLFGISVDVATMVNVLYLAVLFGSVYGIGGRLGGRRVGLLAAFVVATLPMIYAMSRTFYLELALAAMVSLSVYLLLASERFENRTASLLFGLSFGLGLLTKRTYLVFILAPLCLVAVRSNAWVSFKQRWQAGFHLHVKDALLSLGLGLALAAAWYLPAREIARQLPLGAWLAPLWILLIAGAIYLLRRTPGPDTNLLSALFLGGTMGSLWYLPRITFVQRLLAFGFGVNDPRERSANLHQLDTYVYFLVQLVNEHLSLVTFALLLVAVVGLLLALGRKGHVWARLRHADDAWWVSILWVVAAYLIFTFSIYRKSRGITPVLPALAIILAAGVFRLPWKRVMALLVVLIIGWGLAQFFVVSYEGPRSLAERTRFTLPVLGETGFFAQGGSLQLADTGETDPGYWVVPDIVEMVDSDRQSSGADSVKLGVLVNNEHVNPDLFGLVVLQGHPGVQVRNLASTNRDGSVTSELFEQDYLVLIDGDYLLIDAAAQAALRHLDEARALFDATFELAQQFPLPDGDTVLLYRKASRAEEAYNLDDYHSAVQTIASLAQEGDAILLVPPEQAEALGKSYDGRLAPYFLPQDQPLDAESTAQMLAEITSRHPVLFVLFRGEERVDPERFVEGWLNEHAYRWRTDWYGDVRLVVYGAQAGAQAVEQPLNVRLGDQIKLLGYSLAGDTVGAGRMVRLSLLWQADMPVPERFAVFAHLLDGEGHLVAQQDSEPVGGSRPTTTWAAGEVIRDHLGILVPPDTPGGEYRLVVGIYQPYTGERLSVLDQQGDSVGDSLQLNTIQVSRP